jgi:hypothetical protein
MTRIEAVAYVLSLAIMAGCNEPRASASASGSASDTARATDPARAADAPLRATVEEVACATHVTPGESLRVRLSGVIGPNGAYSLQEIRVTRERNRIIIEPLVQRQPEGMFMQMIVPLERTLALAVTAGTQQLEVVGADGKRTRDVVVTAGARRPAPETQVALQSSDNGFVVEMTGVAGDGFIERIDYRIVDGETPATWLPTSVIERAGPTLRCLVQVPAAVAGQRFEARAVDGQGVADPSPASMTLP